ncbi:Pyridoxal-phosphate-dependent serine hydroxymethyltransferase [Gossypium australe]|uniref:Pyridoxal-phosphate-dependent serine hydroxymethyltransferase n=1 Tax=Gossypium australe TaxID=47621 RepID=A0A5B6UWG1_9ROSI|nr:Pyridoxal-phosphate-dependent serine hydroxymethyltransferase [Gossypium australe]
MWTLVYRDETRRKDVEENDVECFRLNSYAQGKVAMKQDKCVRSENGLHFDLKNQVAPHQEQVFKTLVEKAKIVKEIKQPERVDHNKGLLWLILEIRLATVHIAINTTLMSVGKS